MQCLQQFAVKRHTLPIQNQLRKIEQYDLRCVKCGHNWTYLATTGHILSLWTISVLFVLTWLLARNVTKHFRKNRN